MVKDKAVLVVGASSGIGRGAALMLGAAGAKVMVAARREAECRAVVEEIKAAGGTAAFIKVDVTSESDVEAAVAKTVELFGRLDCAVNGAGISLTYDLITDIDAATFDQMFAVNVRGTFFGMKHEIRQMVKQGGGGSIVNVGSVGSHRASPTGNTSVYTATKHAMIGLTRSAAISHGKHGIRVNCVSPTVVSGTPMIDVVEKTMPELLAPFVADIPMGRMCRVDEVAKAILWFCSDESSFVNGQSLLLDGGHTAK